MHSPLRRQLAAARTPSRTPKRLQPDAPQLQQPLQQPQWDDPEQSSRVHLTPRRAVPTIQRAWERKPRAGQNGKTVWKRPQRNFPSNQLRSKTVPSANTPLGDKTNVTPRKVVKKARLTVETRSAHSSTDPIAKPIHFERRSSLLPHKSRAEAEDNAIAATSDANKENEHENSQPKQQLLPLDRAKLPTIAFELDLDHQLDADSDEDTASEVSQSEREQPQFEQPGLEQPGLQHPRIEQPQFADLSRSEHVTGHGEDTTMLAPEFSIMLDIPVCNESMSTASSRSHRPPASPRPDLQPAHDAASTEVDTVSDNFNWNQCTSQSDIMQDQALVTNRDVFIEGISAHSPLPATTGMQRPGPSPIKLDLESLTQPRSRQSTVSATSDSQDEPFAKSETKADLNHESSFEHEEDPTKPSTPDGHRAEAETSPASSQSPTSPTFTQEVPLTPGSTTTKIALNDDETMLHAFLSRANASKAARIAKRSSDSNKRDSDIVKTALASPAARVQVSDENESPSEGKSRGSALDSQQADELTASPTLKDEPEKVHVKSSSSGSQGSRRSKRKHVAADPLEDELAASGAGSAAGHITFAFRRRDEDGNDRFSLKRTEAQEWAMAPRSNTRRNKAGALPVSAVMTKLRGGEISPDEAAAMYAGGNVVDGSERSKVKWNEQLVKFFEDSAAATRSLNEDVHALQELSANAAASSGQQDSARPRARRAKALGAMNGTPAKSRSGKVVLDDGNGFSATVGSDPNHSAKATKAKRPMSQDDDDATSTLVDEDVQDSAEVARPRRLPAPAVRATRAATASSQEQAAVLKESSKPAAKSLPVPKTRSTTTETKPAEPKTSAMRSALPTRRGVRSRQ